VIDPLTLPELATARAMYAAGSIVAGVALAGEPEWPAAFVAVSIRVVRREHARRVAAAAAAIAAERESGRAFSPLAEACRLRADRLNAGLDS
jgi:hypothetical protein